MFLWILIAVSASALFLPLFARMGRGFVELMPDGHETNLRLPMKRRPDRRTRAALRAATSLLS